MKKIFFILENLGEGGGGSERFVVNLCNELSKKNPNVYLLSLTNKGNFYRKYINKKVNLFIFPFFKSIHSFYYLYKFLKKNKPKIVFSTSFHVTVYAIIIKVLTSNNFFLISRISNNIHEYFKHNKSIKLNIVYFLYFNLLKYIDYFICPSKGLAHELKIHINRKYHNKILHIRNLVDENFILNQSKLNSSSTNFIKKKFFLNIARLVSNKDHITLIKAFKYFLSIRGEKDNNYCLVIIGVGNLIYDLKNLIKKENLQNKIIILQNVNNPYVFIKKSKIFVLSSIFEGYPNVLLEAQVLNKKIISTDCKHGPREILGNGKYGYLVKTKNYKSLGLTMDNALNNKNRSISLIKLKKRNSLELIAQEYFNLFERLNDK